MICGALTVRVHVFAPSVAGETETSWPLTTSDAVADAAGLPARKDGLEDGAAALGQIDGRRRAAARVKK